MFTITESADKHLSNLFRKHNKTLFRVVINSGGCNGFSYGYDFTDRVEIMDIKIPLSYGFVLIDSQSLPYLEQTTMDYEDNLIGSSLIFKNEAAISSCGCGQSFAI